MATTKNVEVSPVNGQSEETRKRVCGSLRTVLNRMRLYRKLRPGREFHADARDIDGIKSIGVDTSITAPKISYAEGQLHIRDEIGTYSVSTPVSMNVLRWLFTPLLLLLAINVGFAAPLAAAAPNRTLQSEEYFVAQPWRVDAYTDGEFWSQVSNLESHGIHGNCNSSVFDALKTEAGPTMLLLNDTQTVMEDHGNWRLLGLNTPVAPPNCCAFTYSGLCYTSVNGSQQRRRTARIQWSWVDIFTQTAGSGSRNSKQTATATFLICNVQQATLTTTLTCNRGGRPRADLTYKFEFAGSSGGTFSKTDTGDVNSIEVVDVRRCFAV